MEYIYLITALLVIGILFVFYFLFKKILITLDKNENDSFSNSIGQVIGTLNQIKETNNRLSESFSGSKRFGTRGELILENALKSSGLVEGKNWIKKKNYRYEGTTLQVEFALIHPSKQVLPIDAHWPKELYYKLIDHRKIEKKSEEIVKEEKKLLKDLVDKYIDKAKEVRKKYTDNSASIDFSIIYCPSESLHHELACYINEKNEMLVDIIQRDHKATLMGPSTFLAFIQAILFGFNTFQADKKAKKLLLHWDSLTNVVSNHINHIEKVNNKIQGLVKESNEFERDGNKLQTEIDKIKEAFKSDEEKEK